LSKAPGHYGLTGALITACVLWASDAGALEPAEAPSEKQAMESAEESVDNWVVITWENDLFAGSDDGYTNGVGLAWARGPYQNFDSLKMPRWLKAMASWTHVNNFGNRKAALAYGFVQAMYTPEDLSDPDLIEDDRPYAGALVWSSRVRTYNDKVSDSVGLSLGVVGPASLAEQTQTFIHKITGSEEPQGWDNQIGNEPVFRIDADRVFQMIYTGSSRFGFDTNLYADAGLGNLKSNVGAGMVFRLGSGLAESFAFIQPSATRGVNTLAGGARRGMKGFRWQLSLSGYATYVFNDITLDGNTFRDSPSAELIRDQYLASVSIATAWRNWGLTVAASVGSDTFEEQSSSTRYGALSITYNWEEL
jgi:hypothetical protein